MESQREQDLNHLTELFSQRMGTRSFIKYIALAVAGATVAACKVRVVEAIPESEHCKPWTLAETSNQPDPNKIQYESPENIGDFRVTHIVFMVSHGLKTVSVFTTPRHRLTLPNTYNIIDSYVCDSAEAANIQGSELAKKATATLHGDFDQFISSLGNQ